MSNVVGAAAGEGVVGPLWCGWLVGDGGRGHGVVRTDVVAAHVGGLGADGMVDQGRPVCLLAGGDLVLASVGHGVGEFHVVVHGFVDLDGKYGR